jgi:hypothetical protein
LAENEVVAFAVLKPLPLKPFAAVPQVTPAPLDQFENVTPVGGVVQVAVGTPAGQVTEAPPPTVTTVCPNAIPVSKNIGNSNKTRIVFNLKCNIFFIKWYLKLVGFQSRQVLFNSASKQN